MKMKTIAWMAGCLVACLVACGGDGSDDIVIPGIPDVESFDLSVCTGWAELPAVEEDSEDLCYVAHFCNGLPGGRNYSVCYSIGNRSGMWSAFPLHECYKGSQNRSDAWAYDPELPQSIQPNLVKGSYKPQPGYSKGHLLASGDRTVNATANIQTFYVTNAAPQWQNSFNSGVWSSLETDCWKNICPDTLYVVSGVWGVHAEDRVTDQSGVSCTVPSHFFPGAAALEGGRYGPEGAGSFGRRTAMCGFLVREPGLSEREALGEHDFGGRDRAEDRDDLLRACAECAEGDVRRRRLEF